MVQPKCNCSFSSKYATHWDKCPVAAVQQREKIAELEAELAEEWEELYRLEKVLDGVREEIHDKPTGIVH